MKAMMQKIWTLPPAIPVEIEAALRVWSPLQSRLLALRGAQNVDQAELFLRRLTPHSTDPFGLKDMQLAVDRIQAAIKQRELVVVYGDYDADGVTSTALLTSALSQLGAKVTWYVPDRFHEGYGLNERAVQKLADEGATLIVTVDCGIRAHAQTRYANNLGVDVIVTDHHLPDESLPEALAVIDPKQGDDDYPYDGFAGVGLAYKLVEALYESAGRDDTAQFLELVAIGTIADLAPLRSENRMLVSLGLENLNASNRMGCLALIELAGYRQGNLDSSSVGFGLGPRINAAGRMEHARHAVELLLTQDEFRAKELALRLNDYNNKRRRITVENLELARQQSVADGSIPMLILASHADYHEGVVGLAASRLVDEFYRPAMLIKESAKIHKGSARSIPEFHITNALDQCGDLLVKHGGHASAAGFSIKKENLSDFHEKMAELATAQLEGEDLRPKIELEAEVEFSELTDELMEFLDQLAPFGEGNPSPLFGTRNAQVLSKRVVGADRRHLKLSLRQGNRVFDAIAFGLAELYSSLGREVDIAYRFERNEFKGIQTMQLNMRDIRNAEGSTSS
jgi:single-stranded-DNA-specific exonuclease